MMERAEPEPVRLGDPDFADVLVRFEAAQDRTDSGMTERIQEQLHEPSHHAESAPALDRAGADRR